jgi:hypothetical protein
MSLRFEAGTRDYFFVTHNGDNIFPESITRMTEAKAAPWLASTVDVSSQKLSPDLRLD